MRVEGEVARFIRHKVHEYEEEGLTKDQISQRLGYDRTTLYRWEKRGIISPRPSVI